MILCAAFRAGRVEVSTPGLRVHRLMLLNAMRYKPSPRLAWAAERLVYVKLEAERAIAKLSFAKQLCCGLGKVALLELEVQKMQLDGLPGASPRAAYNARVYEGDMDQASLRASSLEHSTKERCRIICDSIEIVASEPRHSTRPKSAM
jgi:hypothetical protein